MARCCGIFFFKCWGIFLRVYRLNLQMGANLKVPLKSLNIIVMWCLRGCSVYPWYLDESCRIVVVFPVSFVAPLAGNWFRYFDTITMSSSLLSKQLNTYNTMGSYLAWWIVWSLYDAIILCHSISLYNRVLINY